MKCLSRATKQYWRMLSLFRPIYIILENSFLLKYIWLTPPMSQHVCDVKLFLKTFCFYFKLLQSTRQKCCFWCCCYFLRVVVVATAIFVHFFSQNFLSKNLTFPISSWKQKRRTQIDDAPLGPSLSYCLCPFCTKACSLSKYVLDLLSN